MSCDECTDDATLLAEFKAAGMALGPAKASNDAGSVEQFSISDRIALEKHLASKRAMRSGRPGFFVTKLTPGGNA